MKRAILITLMVLLTLVLLLLAGAGILLATLNPNDYKEDISAAIYKATGRQVHLQDDMEMAIFPWIGLKTGRFVVSDPPAFGADPFLSAESASLHVALLPLITGKVEVTEVLLDGVRLKLVETATGQKNWEMGKPAEGGISGAGISETPSSSGGSVSSDNSASSDGATGETVPLHDVADPPVAKDGGKPLDLSIESLQGKDIEIVYRNLAENLSYRLNVAALELRNLKRDMDMPLNFSGSFADEGSGLKASLDVKAVIRVSEDGGIDASVEKLALAASRADNSMQVSTQGTFSRDAEGAVAASIAAFDAQGTLNAVALKASLQGKLTQAAGGDISGTLGNLSVSAEKGKAKLNASMASDFGFSPEKETVSLTIRQGKLQDAAFSGNAMVSLPRPSAAKAPRGLGLTGELTVDKIDLDALLALVDALKPAPASAAASKGNASPNMGNETVAGKKEPEGPQRVEKGDGGLDAAIKSLDADFTLSIGSLRMDKLNLSNISAHVKSDKGRVNAPYSFALFGGTTSGTATADLRQNTPSVRLTAAVKELAVGQAMQAFTGKQDLTGTLAFNLDVNGKGLDWKALAPGLGGKGNVSIVNGEVKGFHLIPPGLPNVAPIPVNFPIRSLSSSFTISNGILSTRDINLNSPMMTAAGGGTANLATQWLNMNIAFLVAGQPPQIPLVVSGPMSKPSYTVDMAELVKSTVKDVLKSPEHVKEILKDPIKILENPEDVKGAIKGVEGLFKRK